MPNIYNGMTGNKLIEEVNSALDKRGNIIGYDDNGPIISDNPQEIKGSIRVGKDIQAERILESTGLPFGSVQRFAITDASLNSFRYSDEYKDRLVFVIARGKSRPTVTIGFLFKDMVLQLGGREGDLISCGFSACDTSRSTYYTFQCPLVYNINTKKFYWTAADDQPIENNLQNHGATITDDDSPPTTAAFKSGYAPTYDIKNKILSFDTSKNRRFYSHFDNPSKVRDFYIQNFFTSSSGNSDINYPSTNIVTEGLDIVMDNYSAHQSFGYTDSDKFPSNPITVRNQIITIDLSKIEEALNRVIGYVYIV